MPRESVQVTFPSAKPAISATQNIFNSTLSTPGFLRAMNASRFTVGILNDQTGTLKAYWSDDGGVNWNQYDSQTVTIPAAGKESGPFDYAIDTYRDWKLDFVNDATAQTTWKGNASLVCGDRSAVT